MGTSSDFFNEAASSDFLDEAASSDFFGPRLTGPPGYSSLRSHVLASFQWGSDEAAVLWGAEDMDGFVDAGASSVPEGSDMGGADDA